MNQVKQVNQVKEVNQVKYVDESTLTDRALGRFEGSLPPRGNEIPEERKYDKNMITENLPSE